MARKTLPGSRRRSKTHTEAGLRTIAAAIKKLVAECPPPQKFGMTGIFIKESGLPVEEWCSRDTRPRPAEMGKWSRLPDRGEWDLICHLFGIRSKEDLEAVLDLADLEKRTDDVMPDRERDRLDVEVRKLVRQKSRRAITIHSKKSDRRPAIPESPWLPPYKVKSLAPLVDLIDRSPMRLSRWYVSRLLLGLHLLGWEGTEAEKERARDLGYRLGKAVTQPLGKGRQRTFSLTEFRYTAALFDKLKGDAFTFANLSRKEAIVALARSHKNVPVRTLAFLVDTAKSTHPKTPRKLFLLALAKQFGIKAERHVYRLLPPKADPGTDI